MATIGIGYGNVADAATLSGTGWSTTKPITKLQNRDLADYAETTGTTATVIIDNTAAKTMRVFALIAHTATAGTETVTVTAGTTSEGTDVYNGSGLSCWPFSPLDDDRDGGHFGIWVVLPADISARYAKIVVSGSATMRFGRAFVGRLFLPTHNPAYGRIADDWQETASTADRMRGGAAQFWRRGRPLRSAPFEYSALPPTEASLWKEIVRTHDVTGELAWIRHTQDRAVQQQHGFLGTMRKLSGLETPFFGHQSAAIALDEIGGAP